MEVIEWKEEYNIGIPQIDKQHKKLVALINRLSKAETEGGMIAYVFDDLDLYVKEHFRAEEELLRAFEYEDFDAHKEEHRTFEGWLSAVRQSFNLGGSSSHLIAESMNAYLRNWLINHILESDMAYRDTLTITEKK
ncbi:bacteriohemerythrin [Terasakiella sp. A23]|uniref:bacteriohemerythrin n=1 Tax=Terasakiella sp. FCG-A23 TaxID=3080561 RepID=UPI0029543BCF|nr:bacteriohemerythrin [Terasakiella sp. A23]MDV7340591.1 bacteriohemerythrin [Terasakiella sp. A23]